MFLGKQQFAEALFQMWKLSQSHRLCGDSEEATRWTEKGRSGNEHQHCRWPLSPFRPGTSQSCGKASTNGDGLLVHASLFHGSSLRGTMSASLSRIPNILLGLWDYCTLSGVWWMSRWTVVAESAPLGTCSFPSLINPWPPVARDIPLAGPTQAASGSGYLAALKKVLFSILWPTPTVWTGWRANLSNDNSSLPQPSQKGQHTLKGIY